MVQCVSCRRHIRGTIGTNRLPRCPKDRWRGVLGVEVGPMTFDELLAQILELLQREQRLSYRAVKRRFALDGEYLEDLKAELVEAKRLAVDEDGRVLVWTGGTASVSATASPPALAPAQAPLAYTPSHLTEKILAARRTLEGERK